MISVCIPTHEQSGYGEEYLRALLDSIALQRGVELEVVVSDNSRDNKLRKVCQGYAHTLGIKYVRNRRKIGISNNTNNAIAKATSDKIKIMYQDDLLVSPVALRRFEECLARKAWAVSDYVTVDRNGRLGTRHRPSWHDGILVGRNTMGMPSVVAVCRNGISFDPRLRTRLDTDYYWQLYREYGQPEFIHEVLVGLRYWDGSASRLH